MPQPVAVPDVEPPPPPYVDDGSHDILQEVLAIEREKDEERMRMNLEKTVHTGSSKRKKSETLDDEYDDILALATPAKKERSSPPTPKPAPVEKASTPMPITIPKPQVPKNAKKEKLSEARPLASTAEAPPKLSNKGKEKEVVPQPPPAAAIPPPPKPKKPPVAQATPINEKKCKELLKMLQKIPEAAIFNRPVDPVIDGCPTCVSKLDFIHSLLLI